MQNYRYPSRLNPQMINRLLSLAAKLCCSAPAWPYALPWPWAAALAIPELFISMWGEWDEKSEVQHYTTL
jgi:hypothetical protein